MLPINPTILITGLIDSKLAVRKMTDVAFSNEEKRLIVQHIKKYFENELQQDIGSFEAEFLLDFFATQVGAYFYNQGLRDAQAAINNRMVDIETDIYELEQPTEFAK